MLNHSYLLQRTFEVAPSTTTDLFALRRGARRRRFSRVAAFPALILLLCISQRAIAQTISESRPRPIAIIDEHPVYDSALFPLIEGGLRRLQQQEYSLRREALEQYINQILLTEEAARKGVQPEALLRQEADDKVAEPTDADVQALYVSQKQARLPERTEQQIRHDLKQMRIRQARYEYLTKLAGERSIRILLTPNELPVSPDQARTAGADQAVVTIVEFSDYQCPYCQRAEELMKYVLSKYKGRIRRSFRDFPLSDIHPDAELAAEASLCAAEQGKFWEYHDLLFAAQSDLGRKHLGEMARAIGLDGASFDACLDGHKHRAGVEQDQQEGFRLGISGTPAFFINGRPVIGLVQISELERLIELELRAAEETTKQP